MADKRADLAGPGISTYEQVDKALPHNYEALLPPTVRTNGMQRHGLNGDILVWNPVTRRRHELTSMGIRVTKETIP